MSTFFGQVPAWFIAIAMAAGMVIAWYAGRSWGRRVAVDEPEAQARRFVDACMALLGLLLGFTFSMALAKHDHRRQMAVTDSNAIGDFYTCVSMLPEPHRKKLQAVVRTYLVNRLEMVRENPDEKSLEQYLQEMPKQHDEMQNLVSEAIAEGTPVAVSLVNTLNGLTSSSAVRLAAVRDTLPASIVLMLGTFAFVSMGLLGRQHGGSDSRQLGAFIGFVTLVTLAVWVILDLNQPQKGLITVSQEPLERLLATMRP